MAGSPDSLEALFERFRSRGDAAALAQVFDLTAARLLQLAVHLSDDPAQAEDALQSTFVTAIEKAADFDASRGLMPWLCGILQLHCKGLRARARRRPTLARLPQREPPEPADLLAVDEFDQGLRAAIDALPAPYRTAVVLRVLHDMEPAAIAHALGEAPGTLRVRLHRGLAMLRERLPRGIAAAAAAPLGWSAPAVERGLDAVGREVFRQAHTAALGTTPAAAAAFASVTMMKKLYFALVAIALATVGWFAVDPDVGNRPQPAAPDPVAERVTAAVPQPAESAGVERAPRSEPDPLRQPIAASPAALPQRGIRVLVRREGDERAAASVGITVLPHDGRHPDLHARRQTTGADGLARFDGLEPGIYGIYVEREAWTEADAAEHVDAPLPIPWDRLRVATAGAGPGLTLKLPPAGGAAATPSAISAALSSELLIALAEQFEEVAEVRAVSVEPDQDAGLSSELPDREPAAVVEVGDGYVEAIVYVQHGSELQGRVVDDRGEPFAGAAIWLVRDGGRSAFPIAVSGAGGSFIAAEVESGAAVFARAPGRVSSSSTTIEADQPVELRLGARAPAISGRVCDAEGRAIARARVRVGDPEQDQSRRVTVPVADDGSFELPAPAIGRVEVLAVAPGHQPWLGSVDVIEGGQPAPLRIVMQAGAIVAGTVIGPDGESRSGVVIRALAEGAPPAELRSGTDGRFRFECVAPGPLRLLVDADDSHRGGEVEVFATLGDEATVELRLGAWASISGRVTDEAGEPLRACRVEAHPVALAEGVERVHAMTGGDGAFEIRAVPGVRYQIVVVPARARVTMRRLPSAAGSNDGVQFRLVLGLGGDGQRGYRRVPCDWLGEVTAPRADLQIRLPATAMPTATIVGRVVDEDGAPVAAKLRLTVDGESRQQSVRPDGSFRVGPLVPGSLRVEILPDDAARAPLDLGPLRLDPQQQLDLGTLTLR